MKRLFLLLFFFSVAHQTYAAVTYNYKGIDITAHPLVGRERYFITEPVEKQIYRYFYGARLHANYKFLGLEGIYTRTQNAITFESPTRSVSEYSESLKVGITGRKSLTSFLSAYIKSGAELERSKRSDLQNNIETITNTPFKSYPYVGLKLHLVAFKYLSLKTSANVVIKDPENFQKNTISASIGLSLGFSSITF